MKRVLTLFYRSNRIPTKNELLEPALRRQGGGVAPVGWSRLPPVGKRAPVEEDAPWENDGERKMGGSPTQHGNHDQHIQINTACVGHAHAA